VGRREVSSSVVAWGFLLSVFLAPAGCGRSAEKADASWRTVRAEDLTPAQQGQRSRAEEAQRVLFLRLSGRLSEAMGTGGPTEAISVCKTDAPAIAAEVSRERGLSIGRTSFRLRNPANTPPPWAGAAIEDRPETPVYFLGDGGELGVLSPIRVSRPCLSCHGPTDRIDPEVKAVLDREYPQDEAVGFDEGDLRGWFWMEVPAE